MSDDVRRARRMLSELRGALCVIALLAIASFATSDAVDTWLLGAIVLVALAPLIAHADQPDPGENADDSLTLTDLTLRTAADYEAVPGVLKCEVRSDGYLILTVAQGAYRSVFEYVHEHRTLAVAVELVEASPTVFVDPQGGRR